MPNDTEMVYVVHRSFQTKIGALATVPLGTYKSKQAAERASAAEDDKLRTFLSFRVVAPGGQLLDGTLGQLLSNMGIGGIGHLAQGPLQLMGEPSSIIQPATRIVPATR